MIIWAEKGFELNKLVHLEVVVDWEDFFQKKERKNKVKKTQVDVITLCQQTFYLPTPASGKSNLIPYIPSRRPPLHFFLILPRPSRDLFHRILYFIYILFTNPKPPEPSQMPHRRPPDALTHDRREDGQLSLNGS